MPEPKELSAATAPRAASVADSGAGISPETILTALVGSALADQEVFCEFLQAGKQTTIRYGDLRREARRYAHYFQRNGVRPGEVVLIILRHSPDLFYSFLGAMLAGAIPSFMPYPTSKQDPRLYWSSHQQLFARIGSGALLTYTENLTALRTHLPDLPLRVLASEAAARSPAEFTAQPVAPGDIAFLQHSSGTTGLKKGVALSHAAVLTQVASYARTLQLSGSDRIVSWLPLYHDMGLIACFLLPLITHTPVVMLDAFEWVVNPTLLFDAIKLHRGSLCWLPNFAFHHLCRTVRPTARLDLSSMRAWINCSEPCRAETFRLFVNRFAGAGVKLQHLQVCYAMAETVFAVTQTPPARPPRTLALNADVFRSQRRADFADDDAPQQSALSTGVPLPGLQVRIVDEHRQPLPDSHVGEIAIAGDCLFSGYFRLPEETDRKLSDGWYHTGDLGFLRDGELYVTGRKNDLIIVHGRNYYAHELEYLVNQVPGVHPGRCVATGWFKPEIGSEEIVIIAETDAVAEIDRLQLGQAVKESLLARAGLTVFDVHLASAGWLVKTTSGKLSRVENLNKYLAALAEAQAQPAALP